MAGGPTTPALVTAASRAGALGFLAAGYKTAATVRDEIAAVRATNSGFGVNVFAPNPVPVDRDAFRRFAHTIQSEAERYGMSLVNAEPREDDDEWRDKLDLLLDDPVPVVSFTFGLPEPAVIAELRKAGSLTLQTVTAVTEASAAAAAGVDALIVQSPAAGGHLGTFTPDQPRPAMPLHGLVAAAQRTTGLPIFAAGGLATAEAVSAVMRAGAQAAFVGTALLLTDESAASPVHRAALQRGDRDTVVTRAFTGRPARGLTNRFITKYEMAAPLGYPALHHLTSPLRRAAVAAGDPELVNLWAGSGYREARAEPAGDTLRRLAADVSG